MVKKILERLIPKGEFNRNVMTLVTGTSFAQLIPILISPILTRLYTPEEFGVFALYTALLAVVGIIATGRYELAIMLPKKESDSLGLLLLSITLSLVVSCITLVLMFLFNLQISSFLGNSELAKLLYLLPISIFLNAIYQSIRYYNNRLKRYKKIGTSRVFESSTVGLSNVTFGILFLGPVGLIISTMLGTLVGSIRLSKGQVGRIVKSINVLRIMALAKKYSSFPKLDIPSAGFNAAAQQAPNFLLLPIFGAVFSGYYFLIQRMFMTPIKVVSTAVAEVYRQEALLSFKTTGQFKEIFLSTFKKLVLVSVIPFSTLALFGEVIFSFVFGEKWAVAGLYAQILSPMFMLKFIVSPLTYAFYVRNKLWLNLIGQFAFLSFILLSFYVGYITNSHLVTMTSMSVLVSILYIMYFFVSFKLSEG